RVINPPQHNRPIRATADKVDDNFILNPWQLQATKAATGPWAGDADPAGAVFIFLAVAVPMELHLDAAVFIGPDFLALRAYYARGLRAVGTGDRRDARCTVLD